MAQDFIPSGDAELNAFADTLGDYIFANFGALGISADSKDVIQNARNTFNTDLTAHNAAKTAAQVARQTKDASRAALVSAIRTWVKVIQAYPNTSDAQRAAMAIPIRDVVPTAISAPITAPILSVAFDQRGEHYVEFKDSMTPNSKAKPDGVHGCAIYRKVTATQPGGIDTMEYVGTSTRSPHRLVYEESQYGSQVFYVGFWETAKGLRGPMSDFTNATIAK